MAQGMRRLFSRVRRYRSGPPDYVLLVSLGLLVLFGLAMLASASSHLGQIRFGDPYHYLKHQLLYGFSFGLVGFAVASRLYYRYYERFALALLLVSVLLLVLVLTPLGVTAQGSSRWLALGPITFQPSELVKITFVLYLASWLSRAGERRVSISRGLMPFAVVIGVIGFLLLRQPATSTIAILAGTALAMYFASGARLAHVFGITALGVAALLVVIYITPYRLERVANFLNPEAEVYAGGFHLNQALIAIGSGQVFGVGYGQSTTKVRYLPEPIGDSIFAVIAEELGFVGACLLIGAFALLVLRMFLLSRRARDSFSELVLIGFGSLIALQVLVNIGAISGLIPLTGTPLPFISYGGTALATFMTMGGIAVNISKYT